MAKISAHGTEIGTITTITRAHRYMSDGKILRNTGHGWKLWKKVKTGHNVQDAFNRAQLAMETRLANNPHYAAYRNAIHATCGLSKRWRLDMAIQQMPDDCDGVWSHVCDSYGDNINATVDDIAALCRLYKAYLAEYRASHPVTVATESKENDSL